MQRGLLINTGITMAIAALVVAGSFQLPKAETFVEEAEWTIEPPLTLNSDFNLESTTVLQQTHGDSVILFKGAKGNITWDEEAEHVSLRLDEGAALVATVAGDFSAQISTPFAQVPSAHNVLYLERTETELNVHAIQYPAEIEFLNEGKVLNVLPIPDGERVKVSAKKVTQTLGRLRLTKLLKEFPGFPIVTEDHSEEVTASIASVTNEYREYSEKLFDRLQNTSRLGPSQTGLSAKSYQFIQEAKSFLTFMPHAEEQLKEDQKDDYLNFATSNFLYDRKAEAEYWLGRWSKGLDPDDSYSELNKALFFVLPGDSIYPVKRMAQNVSETQNALDALRSSYHDILSLLKRGDFSEAKTLYKTYQVDFAAALDKGLFDGSDNIKILQREYMLLIELLRSDAVFYDTPSIEFLSVLEDHISGTSGTEQDLDEERLFAIQTRIAFLEQLFDLLTEQKVSVQTAAELADYLIQSAQDALAAVSGKTAIQSYFETQLQTYALSTQFIKSPEFSSYDSFEEGLEDFQDKVKDLEDLNAYLQQLRTGQVDDETNTTALKDAILEVGTVLGEYKVRYNDIIPLGDADNRLFEIQGAQIGTMKFETNYDRITGILYDVSMGDIRFSSGILLARIEEVLKASLQAAPEEEVTPVEEPESEGQTMTATLAVKLVKEEFKAAGLNPLDYSFRVVDLKENTFSFEGIIGFSRTPVKGQYDADTKLVSKIIWTYDGKAKTLGDLKLDQLLITLETAINELEKKE